MRATAPLLALALLAGCSDIDYTPITFTAEGDKIIATGAVDRSAIKAFQTVIAATPGAKLLVLQTIEGSVDDEANLELSQMVRDAGLSTLVPSGGMVASGGTDLFLAGRTRTLGPGACVGVHSWGGDTEGRDVPRDSADHAPYLAYYRAMGIPEHFYWFTLDAAPAAGMHWMTAAEADRFSLTTAPAPDLGTKATCERDW